MYQSNLNKKSLQTQMNEKLFEAVKKNNLHDVRIYINRGGDMNEAQGVTYKSAFLLAVEKGYLDIVEHLVTEGADINLVQGPEYHSAFKLAVKSGHLDIVKYFVSKGANLNEYGEDFYPNSACCYGHLNILEYFISLNYSVKYEFLISAVNNGHLDVVKFLLERGFDVHTNSDEILNFACFNGNAQLVKYLVELGLLVNDNHMKIACEWDHLDLVKYFLSLGGELEIELAYELAYLYASSSKSEKVKNYIETTIYWLKCRSN